MAKSKKMQPQEQQEHLQVEESESVMSSEDDDAALLTNKVEEKLLSTIAKIRMKHPSIYQSKEDLYEESDFSGEQHQEPVKSEKHSKYTYKDLVHQAMQDEQDQNADLPPVVEQKRAKEKFKKVLSQNIDKIEKDGDDLFKIKQKVTSKEATKEEPADETSKFQDLTRTFKKDSKKMIQKVWNSQNLDQTDLFLKNYILNKKWLSSKFNQNESQNQKQIDEEDEERSQEMDEYEAQYNFRFEEPGGTQIKQYPRQVQNSLRQKVQSRREQRKKKQDKKRQEEQQLRVQAEKKKQSLKKEILEKIVPQDEDEIDHDWFFCDDCCKGFIEGERMWECKQCQDFMLCDDCNQIIIHKHPLKKGEVPKGFGAPQSGEDQVKQLQSCNICRRRITPNHKRYQYTDRNYIVNSLCQICYDSANLQMKKKYKQVEAKQINYEEILDQNPEKIKELTKTKQIQQLVDEYLKNDFQDVLAGGLKTKFKYIDVKPESYGLSDQQILYGEDKELNKYVSIKKLAPYREGNLRLRNSIFNKKIKGIKKSVKSNKTLLEKGEAKIAKMRYLAKRKNRVERVKKRMEKKMKLINLSSKEAERNHFVSNSRLLSYGLSNQQKQ